MKGWQVMVLTITAMLSVATIGTLLVSTNSLYNPTIPLVYKQSSQQEAVVEMYKKEIEEEKEERETGKKKGKKNKTKEKTKSALNDKVSILGDSWSDWNSSSAFYKPILADGSAVAESNMWWSGLDIEKNNSIGGSGVSCSPAALDSRDKDLGKAPGRIVVLLGGNDYITKVWTKDNYKKMINNIKSNYPSSIIFLCGYAGIYNKRIKDGYIKDLNKQIKEVAGETSSVYIDVYGEGIEMFSDDLHPNLEGQAKLGKKIKDTLKNYTHKDTAGGNDVPKQHTNSPTPPTQAGGDESNPNLTQWDFNGTKVWVEKQSGKPWNTYKATGGSIVTKAGCMLYASAIAGSWSTGSKKSVYDVVTGMGYGVSVQNGGYVNVDPKLPAVGNTPPVSYQKSCAAAGATCSTDLGSNMDAGLTQLASGSCKGLLVHCDSDSSRLVSSGGQHWFCILKADGDKYLVASSNTSKQGWMSKAQFTSGVHYNHVIPFN